MSSWDAKLTTGAVISTLALIWFHPWAVDKATSMAGVDMGSVNMKHVGFWLLWIIVFWLIVSLGFLTMHEDVIAPAL